MQSRRSGRAAIAEGTTGEVALLLACCRWPVATAAVRTAATPATDWSTVLVLARRHRVQGLVHHALATAAVAPPDEVRAALAADARGIAARNLQLAAESLRLVRRLEAAATRVMVLKGTPLAMLAYGTLATKVAWDIDLLVPAGSVAAAARALADAGYACVLPGPDPALLAPWHDYSKESVWRHGGTGIHVELHGALVDNPHVLPGIDAHLPARRVAISPGMALPTLGGDALFAYLCVHGAASGWRRAKWLADVAALLAGRPPEELVRLHARARALGAGRAAGQALLLARDHLALPLPEALAVRLRRDPATRLMTWLASRMLTAPHGFDDPAETATGTLPIHLMQAMILPGWRFTLAEVARKAAVDPRVAEGRFRRFHPLAAAIRRLRRAPPSF